MRFEFLGAQVQALRDCMVPKLTGEQPGGTPFLTTVVGLIGRDWRASQESADASAPNGGPQNEPNSAGLELDSAPEDHGLSPSEN